MKTNPNDKLTGTPFVNLNFSEPFLEYQSNGLTKREYFAAKAMQGMLVSGAQTEHGGKSLAPSTVAKLSVQQADALITALNEVTDQL